MSFNYDNYMNSNKDYCEYCGLDGEPEDKRPRYERLLECDSSWDIAHYLLDLFCKKQRKIECPQKCEFCITEITKYLDEEI